MILETINTPLDIKKLTLKEMETLAQEIRAYLLDVVSQNGGHLAPNLGVVELTIALHYVFNSPEDKIVWDVGHQSYVHKILTGRREELKTLRQFKGLSGFPKRCESVHDCFDTGHSSTSISAALGLAMARDLKKEKHSVLAVLELLSEHGYKGDVTRMGVPDCFLTHGKSDILRRDIGLDAEGIIDLIKRKGWFAADE